MLFTIGLTFALALNPAGVFGCKDQCCDLNCWEQCFVDGSPIHSDFYQQVYQIVQTVRSLYTPCSKPHGTCYLLDSSMPLTSFGNQLMDFERNLASIIALTQPVSNDCNPFFVNKFHRSFAWYAWSWQCKDKCQAAQTLATSSMRTTAQNGNQPSWIGGGCILCDHAFNNGGLSCSSKTEKELLIGFANSAITSRPICNSYHRVIIGTTPATTWLSLAAWASPGLAYQLRFSASNLQATKSLLRCLNYRCCPSTSSSQFPIPVRRSEDVEQKFSYNTEGNKEPKEFSGSFDQFKRNVLDKVDTNQEPTKCRTSRDCPRNMRCVNGQCVSFQIKGRDVDESAIDEAASDMALESEEDF